MKYLEKMKNVWKNMKCLDKFKDSGKNIECLEKKLKMSGKT